MQRLCAILGVLLTITAAHAQNRDPNSQVKYERQLPNIALRLLPQGARSLFWGRFTSSDGKPRAVHLFGLKPQTELDIKPSGKGVYHFGLHIFQQTGQHYELVNQIPLTYRASISGPVKVGCSIHWLSAMRRAPLLVFDCFTQEAYLPGNYGDGVFIALPDGWTGTAAVQTLHFGISNSSGCNYEIQHADDGVLQVEYWETENSGDSLIKTYRWNGKQLSYLSERYKEYAP